MKAEEEYTRRKGFATGLTTNMSMPRYSRTIWDIEIPLIVRIYKTRSGKDPNI